MLNIISPLLKAIILESIKCCRRKLDLNFFYKKSYNSSMASYGLNIISSSRTWCYDQWAMLKNREDPIYKKVARIAAAPLLAIATLFAEIFYWFCAPRSPADQWQKLIHLHSLEKNFFLEAQKHPDRNRFSNILPNEPTRFKLAEDPNFYFNANWVLGGKAIACQGPLEAEISQFWKMVWHSDVKTIAMLANPIENGRNKCSEYWIHSPHGNISVKMQSEKTVFEEDQIKIIERTIQISKGSESKLITQYHLQNWPDFGVVSPRILGELVKLVSKKSNGSNFLAHCSAGVGRTGTFLAAYQAYQEKSRTIFAIASNLRDPQKGRVGMIQTPEQYSLANSTAKLLVG